MGFLKNCEVIPHGFLSSAESLVHVNLAGLNVRKIEQYFLFDRSNVREIDLSPLNGVEKIDKYFLFNSIARLINMDKYDEVVMTAVLRCGR